MTRRSSISSVRLMPVLLATFLIVGCLATDEPEDELFGRGATETGASPQPVDEEPIETELVEESASAATPDVNSSSPATLVAPGSGTPSLEQGRRALAQEAGVDPEAVFCWENVYIKSRVNGRYVSTRVEEAGLMRASSDINGPWESFSVCRAQTVGKTRIWSNVAKLWVSTRIDEGGLLRASARLLGEWEYFYTSGNPTSNQSRATVFYANANDLYVSTRLDEGGLDRPLLRAIGENGPWEQYSW